MNIIYTTVTYRAHTSLKQMFLTLAFLCLFVFSIGIYPSITEAVSFEPFVARSASEASQWNAITYGEGLFVAVSRTGINRVMTSPDGITWTGRTAAEANTWTAVTYGDGQFVALAEIGTNRVMTSPDGITWTARAAAEANTWQSITYGSNLFVAVSADGINRAMTSPDGITWTARAVDLNQWYGITYAEGLFVAVAQTGTNKVMTSPDGITWTARSSAASNQWRAITYGDGQFVAVADTGTNRVMTSPDGIIWSAQFIEGNGWASVTYGNGQFVAVADTGTNRVVTSQDGITWTPRTASEANSWYGVTYGNNLFVAVSFDGTNRVMTAASFPWSLAQTGFQFRDDDGNEVAATDIGGQNSSILWPLNDPLRFRAQIESSLATTSTPYFLQYKATTESGWHTVGVDDNFPTIVATSSGRTTAATTSHAITLPSGKVGDLLLVISSQAGSFSSLTTSTGWNELGEQSNTTVVSGAVFWKMATDADTLTITSVQSAESSYIVYRIRNAGTPSGTVTNGSGTNSNPPSHSTDQVRKNLWIASRSGHNTVVATAGPAAYYSLITQAANTVGGASSNATHTFVQATTSDPGIFTSATEQHVTWTIAVPPKQTPTVKTAQVAIVNPSTGGNDASAGSLAWTNTGNTFTSNDVYASVTTSSTTASNYLTATGLGLNIPLSATITGVTASIERHYSGGTSGTTVDNSLFLIKNGVATGTTQHSAATWTSTPLVLRYGSPVSLWGTTLTPAVVNASNFGIALSVRGQSVGANRVVNIDHIVVQVYYTIPAPIGFALSTHIATIGASTTAQLNRPGALLASDFSGGHITDNQGPTPIVRINNNGYSEIEWSVLATSTAATNETYELRATSGTEAGLTSYTGNALWRVGTYSAPPSVTLSGTAYSDVGVTTLGSGVPLVAAIGLDNPVLYATTTRTGGVFSIPVATSTAGVTWTPHIGTGEIASWYSITYGKGLFVAVSYDGTNRVKTSPDGITWTARSAAQANTWTSVTYGNGLFVAVSDSGTNRVMTSPDGITWTARSAAENNGWASVTYGNGLYVAVAGFGTNRVMTSPDGITWTARSAAQANPWNSVTYGNGVFVAVTVSGTNQVMTSPDGITWTARSAVNTNPWYAVTYGKGLFVAVSYSGTANRVMTSPNGITWTLRTTTGAADLSSITYGNGLFVAMTDSATSQVMTSQNGITWTSRSAAEANGWTSIAYGNGVFVAVSDGGPNRVMRSTGGFGFDTPVTVYVNSTSSPATTYRNGYAGTGNITSVPLYGNTLLSYNATTSATSSVIKLDDLFFFDSTDDSSILYTAPTTGTTTLLANFIMATGTTRAPATLSLMRDVTQRGTFDNNRGSVYFSGTSLQVATGTMTGTSKFYNLGITNTSGNGSSTQSVAFGAPITATGTFSMRASTSASFRKGSSNNINNLSLQGTTDTSMAWLRSSTGGQQWFIDVDGTQLVNYANVKDSNASAVSGGITSGGGRNSGNNTNWFFNGPTQWNATDWTSYDTLTIDATKIDTALTNFPVYVNLDDMTNGFWSGVTSGGGDIRVTTNDGVPIELAREIVTASTTLQTGEMYFKANSISSTTNTVFRIYYNGVAIDYADSQTYGAQNVWTNDFLAVYHLGENPAGGANAIQDSTSFLNHGTGSTTMTSGDSVTGKLGKGVDFDGVVTDVVLVGTSSSLTNIAPISVCTWYQHDTYPSLYGALIDKSTDGQNSWNMYIGNGNEFGFLSRSGGYKEVISAPSGWQYMCSTADDLAGGQYITQYKNGVNLGGAGGGFGVGSSDTNTKLRIGSGNGAYPVDGRLDEIRISSSTRTASWIKAEYYNQSTSTSFYTITVAAIVGSSTISNHDAGQTANAFNSQNKTDASLFAFKLASQVVPATVTNLVVTLSGVQKISASSFTSIRLFRDRDSDGLYDATDTQVGGAGVMSIAGQQGTLTFTGDFTATTSLNYIIVADWSATQNGSFMTMSFPLSGLTMTDIGGLQTIFGTVSSIQHSRNNRGGGSVNVAIGGDAPLGDGIRTGGTNVGGEQIGTDPNFKLPTSQDGSWQNAARAYDGVDGTYATTSSAVANNFRNHEFGVQVSNVIGGIELKLEISGTTAAGTINVQLSWDGGSSWTSAKTTPTLSTTDTVRTLGSQTDLWGRTWTASELSNANFAVRLTAAPSTNTVQVDAIQVRVYHQSAGGGGGGGGAI